MEKKNMVLLTVIAVATLLVAVVGATFAYFTATASPKGDGAGSQATITTTKLDGANVTFEGESQLEMLNYPGGLAVYGAKATIAKQQEMDQNNYEATFSLKIEYVNKTGTNLDWELYMVDSKYGDLDSVKSTTCELKHKQEGNELQLWYSDKDDNSGNNEKSCTGSGITTALNELSPIKIASGKLKANTDSGTITKGDEDSVEYTKGDGEDDLSDRKINTSDLAPKYYYLIVKYPNQPSNQSTADEGKEISAKLSIDGDIQLLLYNAS